jgi:hypothetical protein
MRSLPFKYNNLPLRCVACNKPNNNKAVDVDWNAMSNADVMQLSQSTFVALYAMKVRTVHAGGRPVGRSIDPLFSFPSIFF